MLERDLRESLSLIGPQNPGLEYAGELVDGRQRSAICAELAIPFAVRACSSLAEACSLLWLEHPARALELARMNGARTVRELAAACCTTPVAIAKIIAETKPKKKRQRRTRRLEQSYRELKEAPMVTRVFMLEPELLAYAREAAAQKGHRNVSRIVRDALWKEVALLVPNAPQFQPRRVHPRGRPRKAG